MQEQNKFFDKILAQVPSYLFDDITLMKMQEDPKKPEKPPGKILLKPDNMIMFRGKLTCAPNTLNNEVHTYYFADFWQKSNYELKFQGQCQKLTNYLQQNFKPQAFKYKKGSQDKAYCSEDFNYDEWMNLINKVALFNRFYTDCYNQRLKNDNGEDTPRVIYTNLRCFRLFHDWDVMGDSTSFPEFVATSFINLKESVKLETQQQSKKLNLTENGPCLTKRLKDWTNPVHLTSTMGKHKAILAHQDTDTQGMGKFFGLIFVMDEKLKLPIQPFIHRPQGFRTVDSIGWTPSQAATSFAGGNTSKLFPNSKVQKESNLNLIYNSSEDKPISNKDNPNTSTDEQNPTLMKMMQYRFNHQTKVSSVIGYLMKMKIDKQNVYDYKKLLNCPNQIWRIVPLKTDKYKNQNQTRSSNINSSAQIFLNQVYFEKENVNGVVVDISSAIFDANTTQYQAVYPNTLELIITCGGVTFQHTFKQKEVQKLFHQESGVLFIQDFKLPNSPIQITINEVIHSDLQNNDIIVKFTGTQTEYNFEYVDKIVKTKIKLPQDQSKIQAKGNFANFQNSVIIELFVTSYGKVVTYQQMKEKNIKFRLSSYSQVDTSGLDQYNTNLVYLKKIRAPPANPQPKCNPQPKGFEQCLTPQDRIKYMLTNSSAFKAKYQSYDNINDTIYAGKLGTIINETNNYLKNLSWINKDGKLRYKFKDQEGSEVAMVFDQSKPTKDTIDTPAITNGMITLTIYLNKDLTSLNNPRAPAIKSVCLIGTIEIIRQNKDKQNKIVIQKITTNQFTGIFYQKELTNPYTNIDWVNKVGSTLRVMGLVYPAMQKIVNLYDFQKISMPSMKRAFEIEDQNHPRYMPATRQMSPIEHRTIRRWLYAPIYDNRMSPPRIPFAKTYQEAKLYLVETLLPAAFKLELTTIPLYLNALYSLKKEGQAAKLIRSVAKDEMKHLFIVSNLINAIGGAIKNGSQRVGDKCPYPVYGQSKPIDRAIPTFPTEPELVFQFTDAEKDPNNQANVPEDIRYIKQFLSKFDIQSCIQQQLLTFILLETPSEIYEVTIENCQIEVEQEIKEGENVTIKKILILLQKKEGQDTKLTFIQKDQHGQIKKVFPQKDLQSLKNLLQNNKIDKNSGEQLLFQKYNTLIKRILNLQKGFSGLSKKILMKQQEKGMQSKTYKKFLTIGMAYDLIQQTLWFLNDNQEHETNQKTFQGNPLKQFTYLYLENMTEIINHRTALEQIRLIIEEGEGSDLFSVNGTLNKASHFFKFIQIYTGSDADIKSLFVKQLDGTLKRKALYKFKRNTVRFPDDEFQSYTNYKWNKSEQEQVKGRVEKEMQVERLTNNLQYTQFPNIYAPISFLNGYHKILQELGSVFNCEPKDWMTSTNIDDFVSQQRAFEEARLTHMENAIAKMRQMTLHATHIVKPNDTYFRQNDLQVNRSTNPSYNLNQPYHYNLKDPKK